MSSFSLRFVLVAGLIAPFALATASFAQPAFAGPPPAQQDGHHWDPAQMRAHMAEHLRAALQLQPGQQAALDAFLDSMKPPEGIGERMRHEHEADEHLSTPERLDKMIARMDERRARFAQMASATKQFYAALSPAQQKAFDAMHAGHEHHVTGGGRWGHEGDHGSGGPHEMGPDGPPHG